MFQWNFTPMQQNPAPRQQHGIKNLAQSCYRMPAIPKDKYHQLCAENRHRGQFCLQDDYSQPIRSLQRRRNEQSEVDFCSQLGRYRCTTAPPRHKAFQVIPLTLKMHAKDRNTLITSTFRSWTSQTHTLCSEAGAAKENVGYSAGRLK